MITGLLRIVLTVALMSGSLLAGDGQVMVRADFPGGNVRVEANDGPTVRLGPDLRGGRPWFYWHFEAQATRAGRVTFAFDGAPMIGVHGPAVSRDGGASWKWLGADRVAYATPGDAKAVESFHFDFTEAGQRVRFAVAIPYVRANLDDFLKRNAGNPHLRHSVLTRSTQGRDVPLLQVGQPRDDATAVLVAARSHACETMASYVLEGFLQEAIADSPAGAAFRQRYVLYAVPFVDVDGVEAGDQGKNRLPHDHNRDYGQTHLYPEVAAIQSLADERDVRLALDLHCPALRGDVHETFYFDGWKLPHVDDNVNELTAWLAEERPPAAGVPGNLLKAPPATRPTDGLPFSHYFAGRPNVTMAATLEVPYTQPQCDLDAAMARAYGAALLRAWTRTTFVPPGKTAPRGATAADHTALAALRAEFRKTYRSDPAAAERTLAPHLAGAASVYQVEANHLTGVLRHQQRRFAEAVASYDAAINATDATAAQRVAATVGRTLSLTADPQSPAAAVEASVAEFLRLPYTAPEQQAAVYEAARDFHRSAGDDALALDYATKASTVAGRYDKGRAFNRVAELQDRLGQHEAATATRRQAVETLRRELTPVPRGVFGALMAGDLFDALDALPTATPDEKRAAANILFDHHAAPVALKERVRKRLAEIEGN